MREPIWQLRQRFPGGKLPLSLVKAYIFILLHALDYLHSECGIVHTGETSGLHHMRTLLNNQVIG